MKPDRDLIAEHLTRRGVTLCPPRKPANPPIKRRRRRDPSRNKIDLNPLQHDQKLFDLAMKAKHALQRKACAERENRKFRAKLLRDLKRRAKTRKPNSIAGNIHAGNGGP